LEAFGPPSGDVQKLGLQGTMLELVDVELTTLPLMVFFRIGVRLRPGHQQHVMKRYVDVADFHRALERELVAPQWLLPRLPDALPERELATPYFQTQMGTYLARLGRCPEALETYSFKNFFQLTDDYQRWEPVAAAASLKFHGVQEAVRPHNALAASPQQPGLSRAHSGVGSVLAPRMDVHRPPSSEYLAPPRARRHSAADSADCLLLTASPSPSPARSEAPSPAPSPYAAYMNSPQPSPLPGAPFASPLPCEGTPPATLYTLPPWQGCRWRGPSTRRLHRRCRSGSSRSRGT